MKSKSNNKKDHSKTKDINEYNSIDTKSQDSCSSSHNSCCGWKNNKVKCFPYLLITLGVLLLLGNLNIIESPFKTFWPLFLIIIGTIKIINVFWDK